MGVELRSFQRKFQTLMGDVKPQIRPRIVVWLDERLAEFKIRGSMELAETLDDPKWIKDYYTSKRQSKAAAIKAKARDNRDAASSTGSLVQPKIEEKSESSNGIAHPEELSSKEDIHEQVDSALSNMDDIVAEETETEETASGFQLVEVKSEQIEEEDDDMIIVGETLAPSNKPYLSQYNPMKQMYSAFGSRNSGAFQRKRQRFGALGQRPFKMPRLKPNIRNTNQGHGSYPSHTVTSETFSSQPMTADTNYETEQTFTSDTSQMSQSFPSELLRIPPHLQAQAGNIPGMDMQGNVDYEVTEDDSYVDYGDESYDSSYVEGDSSLMYDAEGNPVIPEGQGDSLTEPVPGTSGEGSSQGQTEFVIYDDQVDQRYNEYNEIVAKELAKKRHLEHVHRWRSKVRADPAKYNEIKRRDRERKQMKRRQYLESRQLQSAVNSQLEHLSNKLWYQ